MHCNGITSLTKLSTMSNKVSLEHYYVQIWMQIWILSWIKRKFLFEIFYFYFYHGSDKKCNFFGTLLCTNLNIILNKNKIFSRKIKENEVAKEIAFQKMIQHADSLSNK